MGFVPLPFVHMAAPIYLQYGARQLLQAGVNDLGGTLIQRTTVYRRIESQSALPVVA